MNEYISSASKVAGTSLAMEDWANQSVAESLITNFEEACGDGLRSNINQVRLYLEDEGMVNVLVTHVHGGVYGVQGCGGQFVCRRGERVLDVSCAARGAAARCLRDNTWEKFLIAYWKTSGHTSSALLLCFLPPNVKDG